MILVLRSSLSRTHPARQLFEITCIMIKAITEMEPDDLSFIEISGEDDSLLPLQHIPTDDVSSLNKIYFTCSPLHIRRSACSVNPPPLLSPVEGIKGTEDEGKLDISSNRESAGKEKVNSNKPEAPKLCMEPQQMKRKKKGGGYNLRKSLAWDKAFFTEEGVLDPSELSLISGNFGKSSGKMLSVIEEDGIESSVCNSEDLTSLEENLFKELPASNASEDRKSSGALLSKIGSSAGVSVASTSSAKRKVLSAHDVSRSKRGGPRLVASASLKRPANTNSMKSTTKELKVSKTQVRKPDTSVHSATVRNNIPGASNLKHNQIAQPAVHIQRNVGLKASSNSIKSAQTDARSGLAGRSMAVKSSVQQARRNVKNSALEVKSSARSQHPLVSKTNNTLQIDDRAPPLPTPRHVSNNHDGDSCKAAISLPSGGSKQYTQLQTAKPSGLRMPSPSLGFFNQSKASASHSLSLRSNQASNIPESNISSFRKFGALNAIHERAIPAPLKMPDMVNGVTASDTRIPSSIKGSSIPTSFNSHSHDKMQSNLWVKAVQVELNVSSRSNSFGILNNQQKLHSSCSDIDQQSMQNVGPSRNEKIHMVDNETKSTDDKLPLYRAPSEQLKNDDNEGVAKIHLMCVDSSGTELENPLFLSHLQPTDITDNQCVEDKACNSLMRNHAASSESQSVDANSDSIKGTVKQQDDCLSSEHNINEQYKTQTEEKMPCTTQVSIQGQKAWTNSVALPKENSSSELENCKTAKIVDTSPEDRCFNGGVVESSHGWPESENRAEAKNCVTGVGNCCTKSQVGDAEDQSVDGILSPGNGEAVLCSSALDKMIVDNVNESLIAANGSDLKSLAAICSIPPPMQDCGFDMAGIAERPHEDYTISGPTDAQFSHDIELHSQTTSEGSEMISKDKKMNMVTTVIAKEYRDCSNSGGSSGCELDLQHFENQASVLEQTKNDVEVNGMIATMQVKNHYVIDDVNEHKVIENKQYSLLMSKHYSNTDLESADDTSYCQKSTSKVHNDWMGNIDTHIVCQQSVEGNQILKASDECLSEDSMPLEDYRESNTGKVADVCLDAKSYCQRGLESPQDLLQHEDVAGFDDKIEKSVVEDAPMQILESSLLVDSYNSNFKAKVVDDIHEQSPVHSLLHSDLEAARSSLDAHGLCLSDKLIVNNSSLEEYWDKNLCGNLVDAVLGQSDDCGNESRSSVVCTQVAGPVMEGGIDEDQKADCPSEDDDAQTIQVNELKSDILSDEASISLTNGSSNRQIKNELENPIFTTKNATMSSSGGVFQNMEINVVKSDISTVDAETSISQRNGGSNCEMQLELEDALRPTEDSNVLDFLRNSRNDKKQGNVVIKPPPHAVPFSDEWLAAFEAAGEEILTTKSGAVQNSPPDKSLPEPGPWSPVKRKNHRGIGPFDCTKFSNGNGNIPPS